MAWSLADVVAPVSDEDFLASSWEQSFLHVPGPADKFVELFPWSLLNQTLATHRLPSPRCRVYKKGLQVRPEQYQDRATGRMNSDALTAELDAGGMLVIDFAEEISCPLRDLCTALERLFCCYVHVNLYAGWRTEPGFDVHWDNQDTLILQVYGRKHWRVWRPTRMHPLRPDLEEAERPETPPIWDDALTAGSLLYFPRGWWHVAQPMDEPCLHLTLTIPNRTGIDLLHWVAQEMRAYDVARQSLPCTADRAAQAHHVERLLELVRDFWSADLLARFDRADAAARMPRPRFSLPSLNGSAPTD